MLCKIIPEKCIACGLCQVYAPNIFDYTDQGLVLFKKEPNAVQSYISKDEHEHTLVAYRKCPVRAIEILGN